MSLRRLLRLVIAPAKMLADIQYIHLLSQRNTLPMTDDQAAQEALRAQFITAMRGLVSSVCIISAKDRTMNASAMTATSPTPLSVVPPSMLVCVNRSAPFYQSMVAGCDFCINILTAEQMPLAQVCAGMAKGEDKFALGHWQCDDKDIPFLKDAQSNVFCTQEQRIPYGSHDIIIGKVRRVALAQSPDPLLYAEGAYYRMGNIIKDRP